VSEPSLHHFIDNLVTWGPLGVFLLAVLDSAGIPMVAGVDALIVYLAYRNPAGAWMSAMAAVIGSLGGSLFLFLMARKGGERYLARFTSSGRGARLRGWFVRYGMLTVLVPALLPIPMPLKIFILSAGALGVHPVVFGVIFAGARLLRYFGLAWLGMHLGSQSLPYLKSHAVALLLIAIGLFLALFLLVRRFGPKPSVEISS
jgi:membrane protein YqaA with SNARE-associated domain